MAPAPVTTGTGTKNDIDKPMNFFYSPGDADDGDASYEYAKYKPFLPDVHWDPLEEIEVVDRGLSADPTKKSLLSSASKVFDLTPTIGTELHGIDLRQLTDVQKDELALLAAERGVVFFRDQELDIHQQLNLARYWGPLHKHPNTPIPREPGLEEVHVVYSDASRRPDPAGLTKQDLWHSDVSYEIQPAGTTLLKLITSPKVGGDTHWASGCALYSSLSPGFQEYLEGLYAVHSAVEQSDGARAAGIPVRRDPIETIHPVVRVHPVTGWKSVYVNPGFTRRIINVPKAESDSVLRMLFDQMAGNLDIQVRFKWEVNSVAIWDNRVTTHAATFDFWPAMRHALRTTPQGEKPMSVEDYEKQGKVAKDRQIEIWKQQGLEPWVWDKSSVPKGYND